MKKNILVTGGSGFLGSHLAETLVKSGHKVTNYDINKSSHNIDGVNNLEGDLQDLELLIDTLKNIDIIYHLAAFADIDKAKNDPIKTMKINVLGTTNLLHC